VASHGHTVVVEGSDGAAYPCAVRRQAGRPVTGDRVLWEPDPGGRGVVVAIEVRRNLLARPDGRGGSRAIAANLDQVVVVFAVEPDCPDTLLDRYLVAATHYGLDALLLLNKTDRAGPAERPRLAERLARYGRLGYATCESSARAPGGVDALAAHLRDRTSVLVGPSGVGKSSLVRALAPDAEAAVGEISAATGHGRHTTSTSTLFHLPGGGELIDSPGVRDFGVWHLPREAIARGFVEIQALAPHCRFRDCRHRGEPGCAVEVALAEGRVHPARLASFRSLTAAD
jgi:ribosome biogenesis GTPase